MERSLVSQRVLKTACSKANYQRKDSLTTPYYFLGALLLLFPSGPPIHSRINFNVLALWRWAIADRSGMSKHIGPVRPTRSSTFLK
jgi:hypothetical protein